MCAYMQHMYANFTSNHKHHLCKQSACMRACVHTHTQKTGLIARMAMVRRPIHQPSIRLPARNDRRDDKKDKSDHKNASGARRRGGGTGTSKSHDKSALNATVALNATAAHQGLGVFDGVFDGVSDGVLHSSTKASPKHLAKRHLALRQEPTIPDTQELRCIDRIDRSARSGVSRAAARYKTMLMQHDTHPWSTLANVSLKVFFEMYMYVHIYKLFLYEYRSQGFLQKCTITGARPYTHTHMHKHTRMHTQAQIYTHTHTHTRHAHAHSHTRTHKVTYTHTPAKRMSHRYICI